MTGEKGKNGQAIFLTSWKGSKKDGKKKECGGNCGNSGGARPERKKRNLMFELGELATKGDKTTNVRRVLPGKELTWEREKSTRQR